MAPGGGQLSQVSHLAGYPSEGGPHFQNLELPRQSTNLRVAHNVAASSTIHNSIAAKPNADSVTEVVEPAGYKAVPQSWRDLDTTFVAPGPVNANVRFVEASKSRSK